MQLHSGQINVGADLWNMPLPPSRSLHIKLCFSTFYKAIAKTNEKANKLFAYKASYEEIVTYALNVAITVETLFTFYWQVYV